MTINEIDSALELPIMEHFYTIQGEGFHSGRAAYFIRIAGCDVGCVWCDVKESWSASDHPIIKIDDLVDFVVSSGTEFAVITGGEPTLYNLEVLTDKLREKGIEIALETSGCYELKGEVDWYCFSPKKFQAPHEEAYLKAHELKVIISHPSDLEWANVHCKKLNNRSLRYLQPEWSKQERILPLIVEYVKSNPSWKVSLQTHKFMNIP